MFLAFVARINWTADEQLYIDAVLKTLIFYHSILNDNLMEIAFIDQFLMDFSLLPEQNKGGLSDNFGTKFEFY